MSSMDVLRQIVQSQMWTSPFRHQPSLKATIQHSKLLSQINFADDIIASKMNQDPDNDEVVNDDDKLVLHDWTDLIDLDAECNELYSILLKILKNSTLKGEGNTSVLLFGRNGFGKSALLSIVMHRIENECGRNAFIYIYLNGKLQTTDIDALYEIVSQLNNQRFGRKFNFNLYGDEDKEEDNDNDALDSVKPKKTGFVDNLQYLVNELKKVTLEGDESDAKKRPIYIVLDNFELFAKRKKQTLLYNLFDLNQSQSSLLNIIGITKEKSVYDFLEKRIRSRFVHKKIFVPNKAFLSQKSFKLFYKIVYNALIVGDSHRFHDKRYSKKVNSNITQSIKVYNDWISEQLLDRKLFEQFIRKLHRFGYSPNRFLIISGMISSILFTDKYFLKELDNTAVKCFMSEIEEELFHDPFLRMIKSLSVNQLIVLIVAAKFDMTKDDKFNFEIIYQTLLNVQRQDSMMHIMSKHKYFECYRQLIKMKFIVPVANTNKVSSLSSTSDILSKIFHTNYDMVRLNKCIDSGDVILTFIQQNIRNMPAWIESWLLNKKTLICT